MQSRLTSLIVSTLMLCGAVFAEGEEKKPSAAGVTQVKPDEAATLVSAGKVTILDVRTADEFKEGHIKGAKNIDFTENSFESEVSKLDKSKPYLVHCASGKRSTASLEVFEKLGFKHLYHLDGGFSAWAKAGKPVEK